MCVLGSSACYWIFSACSLRAPFSERHSLWQWTPRRRRIQCLSLMCSYARCLALTFSYPLTLRQLRKLPCFFRVAKPSISAKSASLFTFVHTLDAHRISPNVAKISSENCLSPSGIVHFREDSLLRGTYRNNVNQQSVFLSLCPLLIFRSGVSAVFVGSHAEGRNLNFPEYRSGRRRKIAPQRAITHALPAANSV